MLVDTEKMIPVTKLQRELTQKLKEVSETGEPVYVLRNIQEYDIEQEA